MPYTIKHDPVLDIIEVVLTGVLLAERDLSKMTSSAIDLQKETGATRFLLDTNGWDVRAPVSAIYEVVNAQYHAGELHKQSRIAVILPASTTAREAASFYETVCYNRGWNVKVCSSRQDAIDWLRGPISKPQADKRIKALP